MTDSLYEQIDFRDKEEYEKISGIQEEGDARRKMFIIYS